MDRPRLTPDETHQSELQRLRDEFADRRWTFQLRTGPHPFVASRVLELVHGVTAGPTQLKASTADQMCRLLLKAIQIDELEQGMS